MERFKMENTALRIRRREGSVLTGTAKFTFYWLPEQDEWKLKRVFSFDTSWDL